jgi:signal transduction histidine kinase/CheY-like chemotaxis protein/CHASE3 domain sensor protein
MLDNNAEPAFMKTPSRAGRRSRAILPGKALAAFLAAVIAIIVIAGISYQSLKARTTAVMSVDHTRAVELQLNQLLSELKDAETGQRGFLLTGLEPFLEPYDHALTSWSGEFATLRRLTADNPDQQRDLDTLEPTIAQRLDELAQTIALKRAGQADAAVEIARSGRGKLLMDRVRAVIAEMSAVEERLLEERTADWQDSVMWSTYVTFGSAGVLLFVIMMIAWLASRDFRTGEAEAWLRRVQMALNTQVQGDLPVESLGEKILGVLVENLGAQVGAVYVTEPGEWLRRVAGHALEPSMEQSATLRLGEGLTGQAAKENQAVHLRELPEGYLRVTSAVGRAKSRELVITPASVDGTVYAVVELGFLHTVDPTEIEVLGRVSEMIAIAIRSAQDRSRLEELLEETQRQAEELQVQQEELRVSNEELEQGSHTLQLSQAQLQNQQAELEQINAQLEEQTHSLEGQRDELARAGVELQRASLYKSEFLANMSHELRTPLNSSLILAKLLSDNREGNLNPEQIKFAQTIYSAGNDLLTLINDILDLSKIEAGKQDVRPEWITIARLVDDLSNIFQPIAAQKQLDLAMRIDAGVPDTVETDPTQLSQILKNLLSNALKFTERGGVSLVVGATDGGIRFDVRDTGIGIEPDQHEIIFEAFRQADGGSNRKFGGTGLGLSISRDLARLLGGDLHIESAPGRGSTFTLSLPARYVVHDATPAPAPAVPSPRRAPGAIAAPSGRSAPAADDRDRLTSTSRSLLIIEDDPAFARILLDLAHEREFQGLLATTAEDGLAMAKRYRPSAIILDVGLPDRSGLSVLDALKRDPLTRHVPVHVISAADHAKTALEMGAAGYALKPIERERLLEAIKLLEAKFTQKLRRVLIVEDDPVLRASTARLLAAADVEIVGVGTAAQALEHLEATTFDCMVLDLSLPDRGGLELLGEMSRGDQYGVPPVIVYTGRSLSQDQVHELEQFSSSIIIKGARSPERLLDEVTLFLHQVESELPPGRQRMLRVARDREAVFEGRHILIVEDDARNVFALASVLEPRGAKIEIARNGREALEHLRQHPDVALVLMDVMMPVMDGLEATRELRKQPQFAKLPIIALTAKAMIDDREKCLEAGANDYIAKPLDVDKLLSLARVWIRK